jgi:Family of unknown function (DUF5681)
MQGGQSIVSKKKTLDSYEVGYGKPPKNTQFQKGISGNPTGRPKKAAEFHSIFMKESESLMTIIDNGQRRRVSKLEAIAKQLHNKALTGNIQALRIYVALYPQLREIAALQSKDLERTDASQFSDAELEKIIADALKKEEKESRKKPKSSTD